MKKLKKSKKSGKKYLKKCSDAATCPVMSVISLTPKKEWRMECWRILSSTTLAVRVMMINISKIGKRGLCYVSQKTRLASTLVCYINLWF